MSQSSPALAPRNFGFARGLTLGAVAVFTIGCSVVGVRTVEEASFEVVHKEGSFELRSYDEMVVAETAVDANYEAAGGIAFDRLFGYISGENVSRSKIAMTAPVLTEPEDAAGEKIAMTAPVVSEEAADGWRVAFVLPSSMTRETAPLPTDPRVELVTVPSKTVAAVRFSGRLSEERARQREQELRDWAERNGLTPTSVARSAGYDPPWTLPFSRRNEVLIDVENDGGAS